MTERLDSPHTSGLIDRLIRFCLEHKLVVALALLLVVGWGITVAPFDWHLGGLPRHPVPVDAIPDIGENQQIVFTEWEGRSPRDVEDQVTYPLTSALLGVPGIKTIRSYSMFGFSTVYIIFKEDVEFYWSRSRLLEKLSSLPSEILPPGVKPSLGPDATALGQVFWYTLEGRDGEGRPAGGWSLEELRSIQDWHVRFALLSAEGVSEVASIGGYVREYQVDADPDAMRAADVSLAEVVDAVRMSNKDVGARTIEVNRVEYVIRGVGFIKEIADIENAVVTVRDNVPIYVRNVAQVRLGPAVREGALDKEGAEAVGGVVVARHGANPLATIGHVKAKIQEISAGLPRRTLPDGRVSQVTIVPFYDRSGLIKETLNTLSAALFQEILITVIVVLLMVMHLRSALLISAVLPVAVLIAFIAMKGFGVDANIVALSGIAIAIGTMVDMGIILTENILRHMDRAAPGESRLEIVYRACREVGSAVVTAIATTVISFLPVFTMEAAEGKLFRPLAFTKTFALVGSVLVALTIIPPAAHLLFSVGEGGREARARRLKDLLYVGVIGLGVAGAFVATWWLGAIAILLGVHGLLSPRLPESARRWVPWATTGAAVLLVAILLAQDWVPLGVERGLARNLAFVVIIVAAMFGFFQVFLAIYPRVLTWALEHKAAFLSMPTAILFAGLLIWQGFGALFGWLPRAVRVWPPVSAVAHAFPGLGKEFMPPLDEGSFLYMPTTMPHASIGEVLDVLQKQDVAIARIPEVTEAVGKLGRAESPLDPAPISMIETVINYAPEYLVDESGRRLRFRHDAAANDTVRAADGTPLLANDGRPYVVRGRFARDADGQLIRDPRGRPFRQWRPALDPELNPGRTAWPGVRQPDDIWDAIVAAAQVPGTTSAPKLQPIATRIVMLQSGMTAPTGVKVKGPDLDTVERVGLEIERYLKEVPAIRPATVFADRIIGKPYLEIVIDREAIARHGIMLEQVQDVIEAAIGGMTVTTTVEGRERYPVRVRYPRELRDRIEALDDILVPAPGGAQIPLVQLSEIRYVRGPQMIRSEDTFLTGYVLFDKQPGRSEVEAVEQARAYLARKVETGELEIPAGVSYTFAGNYENHLRSMRKLMLVVPLTLLLILIILYLEFKSLATTALIFSGVAVAWAGGLILIWLYGRSWFLDVSLFGVDLQALFQVHPINLSVAVWVGFLALFGVADDDGVVMASYLDQSFAEHRPRTVREVRAATRAAALRRVRPCLMTGGTTILALLPVMTSTGRGADVMVPMAIPSFGGMLIQGVTMFIVPVLYAWVKEMGVRGTPEAMDPVGTPAVR